MHKSVKHILFSSLVFCFITLLAACASIGRPEGGPRDEEPPVFVRSNPAPGQREVAPSRLEIFFDENVQLDDAFNKVIVSPTLPTTPVVRATGKRVTVELRDTLADSTTYTVDFADAIKDLNEGNILDGFALDFSTGPDIDTLRISGLVLEARTLEPAQGVTVGVYREPADTTFSTKPLERIARTNQRGQFTVRNLKPGRYSVYALNDINRDHRWDRTEDVAFADSLYVPWAQPITVTDTLRTDHGTDSLATRPGTAYLPDDVLLTWFNENYRAQYLKDHQRPERRRLSLTMGAPTDSLPTLTFAKGPLAGKPFADYSLLQRNADGDSLVYWLRTAEVIEADSLTLAVRHQATDTLSQIVWQTDTLNFVWREPKKEKEKKDKEKKGKSDKEGEAIDSVAPPLEMMALNVISPAKHEIYAPLMLQAATPVAAIDTAGVNLFVTADTVWSPARITLIDAPPDQPLLQRRVDFERKPGMKYRLTVDSAAVTDIYGLHNRPIKHEFTVKTPEEYANLQFNITAGAADTSLVVELLSEKDNPVRTTPATAGGRTAKFDNVTPGTYYARLFIDRNGNGIWDTGSVNDRLQPEEVYYYSKKLDLRANWDVEQAWAVYEVPIDQQKPRAITKNKPKLKKGEREAVDDEDVEYDEWGEPIDKNDRDRFGNPRNSRNQGFGGFGGLGGGKGGIQQSTGNIQRR